MCARACVHDVFAIYDNDILPMLIMIKINIIILYFIQIRHTDDFPSTGTGLVYTVPISRPGHNAKHKRGTLITVRQHFVKRLKNRHVKQ